VDAMISRELLDNLDRSEIVLFAKVQDLLLDLIQSLIGWIDRYRLLVLETGLSRISMSTLPALECRPTDAKISACLRRISDLLSVAECFELPIDLSDVGGIHKILLQNPTLHEVSHQSRHTDNAPKATGRHSTAELPISTEAVR
jgi:hypothetical protein